MPLSPLQISVRNLHTLHRWWTVTQRRCKRLVKETMRNNTVVFKLIYFHCTLSHAHTYTHILCQKDLQSFTKPLHTYKIVHCLRHTRINIYIWVFRRNVQVIIGTSRRQASSPTLHVSYLSNRPLKQARFASTASTNRVLSYNINPFKNTPKAGIQPLTLYKILLFFK